MKGYSIGGKTGTSEDGVNTNKYIASFIGVASIPDPDMAILITLYNPTGEAGHQGGGVAAPVAAEVLGEVLPALEIEKQETENVINVSVPEVRNISIKEAKAKLKEVELNFNINFEGEISEEIIVREQLPKPGISIREGTKVELFF